MIMIVVQIARYADMKDVAHGFSETPHTSRFGGVQ